MLDLNVAWAVLTAVCLAFRPVYPTINAHRGKIGIDKHIAKQLPLPQQVYENSGADNADRKHQNIGSLRQYHTGNAKHDAYQFQYNK